MLAPLQEQSTQQMTAAAAASAIVREAAASAVVDALEGMSEEEKAAKIAATKEEKMRKVIRCTKPASSAVQSRLCMRICTVQRQKAIVTMTNEIMDLCWLCAIYDASERVLDTI